MPKMIIFNTSPIQYIYQLGLIDILKQLYYKVYIPDDVFDEIEKGIYEGIDLPDLRQTGFFEILDTKETYLSSVVRDLGKGETAVILHGLENIESTIVIDDFLARKVAMELEIRFTGTAGVLIAAKNKGLIQAVKPYLELLTKHGFYLAPKHKSLILKKANEVAPNH